MNNENYITLKGNHGSYLLQAFKAKAGICFLGLDSEGTGRETHNLLRNPVCPEWQGLGFPAERIEVECGHNSVCYNIDFGAGSLVWKITSYESEFTFELQQNHYKPLYDLRFTFDLNQQYCPTAVLPHDLDKGNNLLPPWLFIAPDHGHLHVDVEMPMPMDKEADFPWQATLTGNRPEHIVIWSIRCTRPLEMGETVKIRFRPIPVPVPEGVEEKLWKQIRRPWLNLFQANAHENDAETPMMLANNVLSNPAVCFRYYSDAMLFTPEPLPGIQLPVLVRHTLEDWFKNRVMGVGNVCCFGKHDLYLFSNTFVVSTVWDYIQMTHDLDWLKQHINTIQKTASFLLIRDQDADGLTEDLQSGNAWSLRDPDRGQCYLESINFGHKNAWTNTLTYRAYHNMADLVEMLGYSKAADIYRKAAAKLRQAFTDTFYNQDTGVLAGWVSRDGQKHDYLFPYINGEACAYGLVEKELGRQILSVVMKRLKKLKPEGWRYGIPFNLVPIDAADMIQPGFNLDGSLGWPGSLHGDGIDTSTDDIGLLRWHDSEFAEKTFQAKALYNGALSEVLTASLIMGLIAMDMNDDADWILEPMLQAAENGELQNGLHVTPGTGGEHHDWDGNPCGYEGFLPEGYYFLLAAMMRNRSLYAKLLPFVSNSNQ